VRSGSAGESKRVARRILTKHGEALTLGLMLRQDSCIISSPASPGRPVDSTWRSLPAREEETKSGNELPRVRQHRFGPKRKTKNPPGWAGRVQPAKRGDDKTNAFSVLRSKQCAGPSPQLEDGPNRRANGIRRLARNIELELTLRELAFGWREQVVLRNGHSVANAGWSCSSTRR